MTTEAQRIHSLMKKAYQGDAWHGPSLSELLDGLLAHQAALKPLGSSHSIWELVNHIIAWERIVLRRLNGEMAVKISLEEDWPPVNETSEEAWQATLLSLEDSNRALRDFLRGMNDDKLSEMIPGQDADVYTTLHGVIQHSLYHAGQIALMRKYCL